MTAARALPSPSDPVLPCGPKSPLKILTNKSDFTMANQDLTSQDIPTGLRRTVHTTSAWLKHIADEMGHGDKQRAYHALRGVLFALRDRLPVDEVMNLSAQLPTLVRGVYFEGYKAAGKPERYRSRDEFFERVQKELEVVNGGGPEAATHAVFHVLRAKVSEGEIEDIEHMLPGALKPLWADE